MSDRVDKLAEQRGVWGDYCQGGGGGGGHPEVNVLGGFRDPGNVFRGDGEVAVAGQVPQEAVTN